MDEKVLIPDEADKTIRLPGAAAPVNLDKTRIMEAPVLDLPQPPADTTEYVLNGKTYFYKKTISENTGEAQIFLVEREGYEYVLKLYYPQFKPKQELLGIIKSINSSCLVKIYDYGDYISPHTFTKRTFELMEYLRGKTLDKVDVRRNAKVIREIAMRAATALQTCHVNHIIHKDIKPGNFFFRDSSHNELVLGDFGIASLCEEEEAMHQTQQARTPIFSAPEMYETIDNVVEIDPKVDFYSLGILLMYIWIGDNPFKGNERSILRLKRSGDLPFAEDLPKNLLTLFQGLTVVHPKDRWGFNEIRRWYEGEEVAVASSPKELALSLVRNLKHYTAALKNPEEEFYTYLKAASKTNTDYYSIFKSGKPEVTIWKLIYTLYPEGPFWLEIKPESSSNTTTYVPCNTVNEVIRNYAISDVSDNCLDSLIDGRFMMWYKNQNEMDIDTYVKLEILIDRNDLSLYDKAQVIMYYLDSEISYSLVFPDEKEFYDYTPQQVGASFNELAYRAFQLGEMTISPNDFIVLSMYLEIRGYAHLSAMVKDCNDEYNHKKFGPYNHKIATYKIIQALGHKPFYRFKRPAFDATTVDDLNRVPKKEIQHELQEGALAEWLAVFYQERYGLKSDKYEEEAAQYLHKLYRLDREYESAKRFRYALNKTQSVKNKAMIRFRNNKILSVFCLLLLYIPAFAVIVFMLTGEVSIPEDALPIAFWEVNLTYYCIAAPVAALFFWFANDFNNLIGSLICGIIASVVLYYIVYIIPPTLSPYIPYLASLLVILVLFFATKKSVGLRSSGKNFRETVLLEEESIRDQVYFACHENQKYYTIRNERAILDYYKELNRVRRNMLRWTLSSSLLMFAAAFTYLSLVGMVSVDFNIKAGRLTPEERKKIAGTWEGTFDDKASTLFIHPFESNKFTGTVTVKFRNQAKEGVRGRISGTDRTITLIDTLVNNVLDGMYTGKLSATLDTITGTYSNPRSGADLKFIYTKALND